jgi:hypothetical protein
MMKQHRDQNDKRRVQLSSLPRQTFVDSYWTEGRRIPPVEQLKRSGGSLSPTQRFNPEVVECELVETRGPEFYWRCEAELSKRVQFSKTEVICEGWDGPSDSVYIVRGSCGLEYQLEFTNRQSNILPTSIFAVFFAVAVFLLFRTFRRGETHIQSPTGTTSQSFEPKQSSKSRQSRRVFGGDLKGPSEASPCYSRVGTSDESHVVSSRASTRMR